MSDANQDLPSEIVSWLRASRDRANCGPAATPAAEVSSVLKFMLDDLTRLIERLAAFASDPPLADEHRSSAAHLGAQLRRFARVMERQQSEDWASAARCLKGRHGKGGWSQTCWNIAESSEALALSRLVADRLDEAGQELEKCLHADTAATLAHHARNSAHALVLAGGLWNQTQRWQKPRDNAKRDECWRLPNPGTPDEGRA